MTSGVHRLFLNFIARVHGLESFCPRNLYSTYDPVFCGISTLYEKEGATALQNSTIFS